MSLHPTNPVLRRPVALLALLGVTLALVATASTDAQAAGTAIMRQERVSAAQMAGWFAESSPGGARPTVPVEELTQIYVEEGAAEGVAGDLAFVQAVLETSWLRWPDYGQVRPDSNNFAGIGACDGGVCGVASFPNARIGVRAQIQHLRAYADPDVSEAALAFPLVDPRFHLVSPFGKARTWEAMGGGNWASDPAYADKILGLYGELQAWAADHPELSTLASGFVDVDPGAAYADAVETLAAAGLTQGCAPRRFCPDETLTRAEAATFLRRGLGLPRSARSPFVDTPGVLAGDIAGLHQAGLTRGCAPDRYCPTWRLTREQTAALLARALRLAPAPDAAPSDVSTPLRGDVGALVAAGLIEECAPGRLCATRRMTRGEAASLLVGSGLTS